MTNIVLSIPEVIKHARGRMLLKFSVRLAILVLTGGGTPTKGEKSR